MPKRNHKVLHLTEKVCRNRKKDRNTYRVWYSPRFQASTRGLGTYSPCIRRGALLYIITLKTSNFGEERLPRWNVIWAKHWYRREICTNKWNVMSEGMTVWKYRLEMILNSRMEPYCSNLNALHEVFCTYYFRAAQANKSQRKLDVVRKLEIRVEKQTLSKMSQKLKTFQSFQRQWIDGSIWQRHTRDSQSRRQWSPVCIWNLGIILPLFSPLRP